MHGVLRRWRTRHQRHAARSAAGWPSASPSIQNCSVDRPRPPATHTEGPRASLHACSARRGRRTCAAVCARAVRGWREPARLLAHLGGPPSYFTPSEGSLACLSSCDVHRTPAAALLRTHQNALARLSPTQWCESAAARQARACATRICVRGREAGSERARGGTRADRATGRGAIRCCIERFGHRTESDAG